MENYVIKLNMVLIYSLIFAAVLSIVFTSSIKKHYWFYYSLSGLIAISTTIYEILRLTSTMKLYGYYWLIFNDFNNFISCF